MMQILGLNQVAGFRGWQPVMRLINTILELAGIGLVGISALMGIYRGTKQAAQITDFGCRPFIQVFQFYARRRR